MHFVGEYRFRLNIWQIILTVTAPCSNNYLQGSDNIAQWSVRLDEQLQINVAFKKDDTDQSWEESCGKAHSTVLYDRPSFVTFNEKDQIILIRPIDEKDLGVHSMLLRQKRRLENFGHVIQIFVKPPLTFIDKENKPYFKSPLRDRTK